MVHRYFNFVLFYRKLIFCVTIILSLQSSYSQDVLNNSEEPERLFLKDSSLTKILRLSFNSDKSDFCPAFYKNGVVFYSNREKSQKSVLDFLKNSEADIFFTSMDDEDFSAPIDYNELIGSGYYEGNFTFYDNFNKMYISKFNSFISKKIKEKDKLLGLRIFSSEIDTSSNELYTLDPLSFNIQGYSFIHPAATSDGEILIFASDMPDGVGGSDLYITKKNRGFWLPPENLGDLINTPSDEYFPYLFQDSILVFTSNRPGGYGKLDLYITTLNNTKEPLNLGAPINSESDDFSLVVSAEGEKGFLTSNRNGESGEDIYQFQLLSGSIQELVDELLIDKTNVPESIAEGDTIELNKISQFQSGVSLGSEEELEQRVAEEVENTKEPGLQIPKEEQISNLVYRVQIAASKEELLEKELGLKYKGERPIDVFQEEGWFKYYIGEFENYFIADKIRKESGVKDAFIAAYHQNNKLALMDAMRTQYQQEREEYNVVVEKVPANWEVIDKQELFFDFNSFGESSLNSESFSEIINLLKQNQDYQLAIFAYADYFGSSDYNLALSAERGKMVKKYLVVEGIAEIRILVKSLGEKFIQSKNSTPQLYDKQENKINRKVEFIIYKIR